MQLKFGNQGSSPPIVEIGRIDVEVPHNASNLVSEALDKQNHVAVMAAKPKGHTKNSSHGALKDRTVSKTLKMKGGR